MIITLHSIFIIAAAVVFLIAAFAVIAPSRVNLIALGLLLFAIAFIVGCTFTGCIAVPGAGVIAASVVTDIEQWALPIANQWITDWIHSHLGASRGQVAASHTARSAFIAKWHGAAKQHAPNASDTDVDTALGAAFDKAATKQ